MNNHVRWPPIENHYRQKNIDHYLWLYPELVEETYVITEKLHGSNFQWYFTPNQPVKPGSRNRFLDFNGSFQGANIRELYDDPLFETIQEVSDSTGSSFRLFGELVGKGIQKGVDYGTLKRVFYFGVMIDDELKSFEYLEEFFDGPLVPVIAKIKGLQTALDFNTEFDSKLAGKEDNMCEGVVIQPYSTVYFDRGSPFLIKKKNEKFMEKTKEPRVVVVDTEVARLNTKFRLYVNDARLQSVFSKEGEIERPNQIGQYIKWVLADAKVDFLKDNDVSEMTKDQLKKIYNVGSQVAHLLRKYL